METFKDNELLTEVPKFDELDTAGSNAPTVDELQDKGFLNNPEHPKEETVTVEMPRGLGKIEEILEPLSDKEVIEKFEKETPDGMISIVLPPPAESESDYNHFSSKEEDQPESMVNLQDLMLDISKDYNLDSLNYPDIKKNILRAFGTIKNILLDNNDSIEMTKEDWNRFYTNISNHVSNLNGRHDEIKKIIDIKTKELNILKSRLGNKHEDIRDIEDELGPIDLEIHNLNIRKDNISKELQVMKAIKTQVFAKERKYTKMFQHVQLMIALAIMIKQKFKDSTELLDGFCSNHDATTRDKLNGYIEAIVNDEWLNKEIETEESFLNELADLTENSLDEQKEQAEYFKNLAIGTMYKVAEMFNWDISIKPNDSNPEADNLVVSQISKKLMNVVNGAAPESNKFTKEDKDQLLDLIKFTDIFLGQGLEKMMNSTTEIADEFKKNMLKFRYKQMIILGKHLFKTLDISEAKRNRLISAILLSTCKLDTLSIVFYLV